MKISYPPGISAYDSDPDPEEVLQQYDAYIVALARNYVPRNIVPEEDLKDAVDELTQAVRFKLWHALQRERITNFKGYIRSIVYSESVDMVRRQKRQQTVPLPLDDNGELYQEVMPAEDLQDPLCWLEQEEAVTEFLTEMVGQVVTLPAAQQRAMICSLKDRVEDLLSLVKAFRDCGVDIEAVHWPVDENERRSLRTSLSIARKKLRALKRKYNHERQRHPV